MRSIGRLSLNQDLTETAAVGYSGDSSSWMSARSCGLPKARCILSRSSRLAMGTVSSPSGVAPSDQGEMELIHIGMRVEWS